MHKICDQISDAIVTDCLKHDRHSRVAVECMIKGYEVNIAGEITSKHEPDCKALAQHVLFSYCACEELPKYNIAINLTRQSPDIAQGIDEDDAAKKMGAGDQGIMFGYATDETKEMLPLPYVLACEALERLRDCGAHCLRPDAKCQVTFDTMANYISFTRSNYFRVTDPEAFKRIINRVITDYGRHRIDTFLISTQHAEDASSEDVYNIVLQVMKDTAKCYSLNTDFKVLVNPTGRFVIGGSFADTGVTGRKIIADTYGGVCRHGGGAFSGKDPTKVDRSAAYMARKIAKDIVRAHFAHRVEVQLAYAIGVAEPVSISVDCFGTNIVPKRFITNWICKHYDLTPAGIISFLGLRDVDYNMVSCGGHFRCGWMPWEK